MSIRRDLLMRTALLRLPDLAAIRAMAMTAPVLAMTGGLPARQAPAPRRRAGRKPAAAKN
ncbi:hypothetical protein [Roseomonas sp. CECT 9278]|uniref:hypothetical protein n=1 Tax=Roseomonas sp. CECT 9278 TaxID=2845823 RepID=UPI001E3207AA|nr:hypothetical protein [Roseomonas sp. CECT 9278]CAH0297125.1 hypothetical protein ROS9278_04417 [Roseomonas sp. CECT 9278]